MRVERKGGGKYGRASCCRIGWRRDEGERRAKGWAGRGRSEKRLLNAMEARLSKRGGKLGVSDAVENARRSYAAGCHGGLWRACLPRAVIESHFYPMTRTYTLMNVGFVEAIPPALFRDNSVYCGAP